MSHQPTRAHLFGPFRLDVRERQLWCNSHVISLQPKDFDLLLILVKHSGSLLTKEDLMQEVWPDAIVEEANIALHISRLRKILKEECDEKYIETVPKLGYRFVAEVREVSIEKGSGKNIQPEALNEGDNKTAPSGLLQQLSHLSRRVLSGKFFLLILLLAAIAAGAYQFGWKGSSSDTFHNMKISRLTSNGTAFEAAISPDGRFIAYIASKQFIGSAHSLWLKQLETPQESQLIAETNYRFRGLAFSPDGNYVYYSQRHIRETNYALFRISIMGGEPQRLLDSVGSAVSFSPDGKQIVFVREEEDKGESSLIISNADGRAERRLAFCKFPDNFSVDGPSWSPDGKLIAAGKMIPSPEFHFRLVTVQVADGQEIPVGKTKWSWMMRVAWLNNNSELAVVGKIRSQEINDQIWRVDYPNGDIHKITNDLHNYRNLNLMPDATRLVTVQSEVRANLWMIDVAKPQNSVQITNDAVNQNGYRGLAWAPDGKIVHTSAPKGSWILRIINADGTQLRQITSESEVMDHSPAVSKDGKHIIFASSRSGPGRIWSVNTDGSNLRELTNGTHDLQPNFAPDGTWFVYSSAHGNTRVIKKMSYQDGASDEVVLNNNWADFPVVSPDGKLIACLYQTSSGQRKIALLPSIGGPPVQLLDLPNNYPWPSIRWHPDGSGLSYLDHKDFAENIWFYPLNGGTPAKLTDFQGEHIFHFSWSPDARHLVCSRGRVNRNVVMISLSD